MTTALKRAEYYAFAKFMAVPKLFRELKTQEEFQLEYDVGHTALADWKKDPNFWDDVARARKEWGREHTSNVLLAVYQRILRTGDPIAAEFWVEFIEDYQKQKGNVNIQVNQTIIELSEERKTMIIKAFENYGLLKPNDSTDPNLSSGTRDNKRSSAAEVSS